MRKCAKLLDRLQSTVFLNSHFKVPDFLHYLYIDLLVMAQEQQICLGASQRQPFNAQPICRLGKFWLMKQDLAFLEVEE